MANNFDNKKTGTNYKPLSADPLNLKEGDIWNSDGTVRAKGMWIFKNGAASPLGGGAGGGLDVYHIEQFEESVKAASFTTGNNATFLGGGVLAGTLVDDITTQIAGDVSLKYTQAAGSLNDFFASPVINLDDKQRDEDSKVSLYFKYDGLSSDIKIVVYDVTNSNLLTDSLDLLEASTKSSRFETSFFVPTTTTQIRYGIQVVALNSGKILTLDDIEFSTNPFVSKNLLERQEYSATEASSTMTNISGELEFSGALTETDAGTKIIVRDGDPSNTRTKWVATRDCTVNVSAFGTLVSGSRSIAIGINGVVKDKGSYGDAITGNSLSSVSGTYNLVKGDFITYGITTGSDNSFTFDALTSLFSNVGFSSRINIIATVETEHIVTPAKGTLTNPVTFTPTGTWTNTTYSGSWEKQGKFAIIKMKALVNSAPTLIGLQLDFSSSGLVIDTSDPSMLSSIANQTRVGEGITADIGTNTYFTEAAFLTTTTVDIRSVRSAETHVNINDPLNPSGALAPFTFVSGDFVEVVIRVPIVGFSSDVSFLAAVPVQRVAFLKDVKAIGVDGGSSTSNFVHTRDLNTVEGDSEIVTLSANQFTLNKGKYLIDSTAPTSQPDGHQLFLYNVTDAIYIEGAFLQAGTSPTRGSKFKEIITITTSKVFEIRQYIQTGFLTFGLGRKPVGTNNPATKAIYTQVKITKLK